MPLEKLLSTIKAETACYGELYDLLADEKKAISHSSKGRLNEINNLKESMIVKLQQYEKTRTALVDQLAGAHGQKDMQISVRQLAFLIGSPSGDILLKRADHLRSIIIVVQQKNRQNQLLIRQSLDLVNSALNLLAQHIVSNSTYQKAGKFDSFPGYRSGCGRIIQGTV